MIIYLNVGPGDQYPSTGNGAARAVELLMEEDLQQIESIDFCCWVLSGFIGITGIMEKNMENY